MNDFDVIKYQILYRRAWLKQNEVDKKLRPSLFPPEPRPQKVSTTTSADDSCGTKRSMI